ncbi:MAG: DUF2203 domain-containing protein [Nitrososphaerota archaeon]|nr:DUF2203 domain-containing protein [Nitrososphaerota archaeon]
MLGHGNSSQKFLIGTPDKGEASKTTAFDNQDAHLFTPQEASKLLPDIRPKMKELIERKKAVATLHNEIEKYNIIGFKTAEVVEKAAQLDALVDDMSREIAELEDLGVEVRDLDYGLVDFPAERYGESVMLCWRYGEPDVSYWHKPKEGYNGRKSLRIQLIQP